MLLPLAGVPCCAGVGEDGGPCGVFAGSVTTANNGGFASVRTRNLEPPLDLSGGRGTGREVWNGAGCDAGAIGLAGVAGEAQGPRAPAGELSSLIRERFCLTRVAVTFSACLCCALIDTDSACRPAATKALPYLVQLERTSGVDSC